MASVPVSQVRLSKGAVKDLARTPAHIRRKLNLWIRSVEADGLETTRKRPGYHDEPLQGDRRGQRSIRLSRQWRAVYAMQTDGTIEFVVLEEVMPHAYRKPQHKTRRGASRLPKRHTDGSVDARAYLEALDGPLTFGAALRAVRESEEWTQTELAERLGTTKQHISDVERDRKVVSADRAAVWAGVLGQSERVFLQLALQDELRRAELAYTVRLESA